MANENNNSNIVISPELRNTVLKKDSIKEVHFTAKGAHYFNAHRHTDGTKYGHIPQTSIMDGKGKSTVVKSPILSTRIVKTLTRAQILGVEKEKEDTIVDKVESEAAAYEEKLLAK